MQLIIISIKKSFMNCIVYAAKINKQIQYEHLYENIIWEGPVKVSYV